jgi:Eukaryotic aspartyl protease
MKSVTLGVKWGDMANALRIPITNVYGNGDYTAQIQVGSNGVAANVILDTGGSTLALDSSVYNPGNDTDMTPTQLAQDITFVTGSWTGPVVRTTITVGSGEQALSVNANLALTAEYQAGSFGSADGMLGLAFNKLNTAYDLGSYFTSQNVNPPDTYPWPFPANGSSIAQQQLTALLGRQPRQDLKPYFSELTDAGIAKNIFSFYTLRSVASMRSAEPAADPLNNGYFILGGGPEQDDLYTGGFTDINVVADLYYNTQLNAIQVQGSDRKNANQLLPEYAKSYRSNSIVDSGTNILYLASDVYASIISSFQAINPQLAQTVQQAQQQVIQAASLNLAEWPPITFFLEAKGGGEASLTCASSTYWQLDAPEAGQATFQIADSTGVQSILGLPLLNNYYTVFDRTEHPYGVVRFASIAPP